MEGVGKDFGEGFTHGGELQHVLEESFVIGVDLAILIVPDRSSPGAIYYYTEFHLLESREDVGFHEAAHWLCVVKPAAVLMGVASA